MRMPDRKHISNIIVPPQSCNWPKYQKSENILLYIWRETPGDEADVPATELPFTYRISAPSCPLQSCHSRYNSVVMFLQGLFFCIRERQLWSGNESVEIRYVNDSSVAETSATLPGVHRHMSMDKKL